MSRVANHPYAEFPLLACRWSGRTLSPLPKFTRRGNDEGATPEGMAPRGCPWAPAQRAATDFASADFLLAAWLAWMTPFEAALSSFFEATTSAACALSLSPPATASRTRRTCVLSSDLTALLRRRAFSFVVMRLIWDLMFATCGLSCAFAEAI